MIEAAIPAMILSVNGVTVPVQSSNVLSARYILASQELEVTFKGNRTYTYDGISPDEAYSFFTAPSKGSFVGSELRGHSFHMGGASGVIGTAADLAELASSAMETAVEHPPIVASNQPQPDQPQFASRPVQPDTRSAKQQPATPPWETSVQPINFTPED